MLMITKWQMASDIDQPTKKKKKRKIKIKAKNLNFILSIIYHDHVAENNDCRWNQNIEKKHEFTWLEKISKSLENFQNNNNNKKREESLFFINQDWTFRNNGRIFFCFVHSLFVLLDFEKIWSKIIWLLTFGTIRQSATINAFIIDTQKNTKITSKRNETTILILLLDKWQW